MTGDGAKPGARYQADKPRYRSLEGALGAAWRVSKVKSGALVAVVALEGGGWSIQRLETPEEQAPGEVARVVGVPSLGKLRVG